MNKIVFLMVLSLSFGAFAQDKDKVSSGHTNVLSSKIVSVGTCKDNGLDVLSQIADVLAGSRTLITLSFELSMEREEVVESYDKRTVKGDSGKEVTKINVKESERVNKRPKTFSRTVSIYDINGELKTKAILIAQASTLALRLKEECDEFRSRYTNN